MNNDDFGGSLIKNMITILQTPNKLDLNLDQGCHSPKSACANANQCRPSKEETGVDGVLKIGTEFESDEHAYKFYNKYAELVGFSVRKDWVNRSRVHGQVISRKFTCSREGQRKKDKRDLNVKKHRKETRTGCLAHMIITRQPDGKYKVSHFVEEHNHEGVNTSNAQILKLEMTSGVSQSIEEERDTSEAQSNSAFELRGRWPIVRETIDHLAINYDNYLRSGRSRDMKEGEAGRLLHYFESQHFENPSIFYATQLDIDDKVSNIFWADDHMTMDYDHFGDVVCLDTTYRTHKDCRPLVQFVGLNHHKQAVIFGAALLYDESTESLKWLIQTFIGAMSRKKPEVILTDQDATTVEAIASVLPETKHCICIWQMYQNAIKHLGQVVADTNSFAKDLRSCIFHHDNEEDFVSAWEAMLENYGLQKNEWLRWMYREREKWAAVYGRNTFFVDRKDMHPCENLSNNIRHHLDLELDVLQFLKHFERVVDEQRCNELESNYQISRCKPRLMGNVVLLKHASDAYTPKAFDVFQREYEKSLNMVVNQCTDDRPLFEYKANKFGQPQEYSVTFDSSDNTVRCSCMKFEYVGMLCSHALKVLDHRNIKVLPSRYFLKRWTKDARVESEAVGDKRSTKESQYSIGATRYRELSRTILKISAKAAGSKEVFQYASRQLDEVLQGVEKIFSFKPNAIEGQDITSSNTGVHVTEGEHVETFIGKNGIECQDEDDGEKGAREIEIGLSDEGQLKNYHEQGLEMDGFRGEVGPNCVSSGPCSRSQPTYGSSQSPVTQNLYNFEANQVVECMFQPHNLVIEAQKSSSFYQPPNFFSHTHDSPSHPQLVQVMDLDVQHSHSSSFMIYDHGFRASSSQDFGSK